MPCVSAAEVASQNWMTKPKEKVSLIVRTWKKEFWRNLLITLLNIESCDTLPSLSKLREDLINVIDSSYLMEDMEDATRELAALLAKDS